MLNMFFLSTRRTHMPSRSGLGSEDRKANTLMMSHKYWWVIGEWDTDEQVDVRVMWQEGQNVWESLRKRGRAERRLMGQFTLSTAAWTCLRLTARLCPLSPAPVGLSHDLLSYYTCQCQIYLYSTFENNHSWPKCCAKKFKVIIKITR